MFPLVGGYVGAKEYGSIFGEISTGMAPYLLTPIGIYIIEEGKRRKSLPLSIAGSGIICSHAGGVIGDFLHIGRIITRETIKSTTNIIGYKDYTPNGILTGFPATIAAFYIGVKICNFTYRTFKSGVRSLDKLFKGK